MTIPADRTALLLLDFHVAVVAQFGDTGRLAVLKAHEALNAARSAGMRVFHVVPNNRAGYPELRTGEPFDSVRRAGLFTEADRSSGLAVELRPGAGEPVVAKSRYSPFWANDLLAMLSVGRVEALVLAGLATSGVVLSAVRDAWDRDYDITVLDDACGDNDPEIHRMLVTKLFPQQATVLTVDAWRRSIGRS